MIRMKGCTICKVMINSIVRTYFYDFLIYNEHSGINMKGIVFLFFIFDYSKHLLRCG